MASINLFLISSSSIQSSSNSSSFLCTSSATASSSSYLPLISKYNRRSLSSTSLSSSLSSSLRPNCSRSPRCCSSSSSSSSVVVSCALKKLSETDPVAVPEEDSEAGALAASFPAESSGVYAVYGSSGSLQFIGISRNVRASILTHAKSLPSDLCRSVKVGLVDDPDRAALTQAWKSWMEEHLEATGKVPPGNESGNSTWVRQPPKKKKKPDLRLTPGRHVQLTVPLEQLIDQLVKENKVVAFIKGSRGAPLCGFSQKVIGMLEDEGVDYESVDVLDEEYNYGLRETLKRYSSWPTFPQVFVNGELIGGCDILSSMYEKGELATLFKK